MSFECAIWAMDQDIRTPGQKLLLIVLGNYCNDVNQCWPSQRTLEAKTSLSRRSVQYYMKALEEAGLIRRDERRRENGKRSTDLITLLLQGAESAPCSDQGASLAPDKAQTLRDQGATVAPQEPIKEPIRKNLPSPKGSGSSARVREPVPIPLPARWEPGEAGFNYADGKGFSAVQIADIEEDFRDWHLKRGTKYSDWSAAWRSWIRNQLRFKARDAEKRAQEPTQTVAGYPPGFVPAKL